MYQIINYYQENNQKITDYKLKSRYLWNDHISYTRNAIISMLSTLPDADAVTARLIQNQDDIGNFISPYYSADQVSAFVDLLKQHIAIAADIVKGTEGAQEQWQMNGKDIVNYMYRMNRMFWPKSVTWPMWSDHMEYTIAQVNARNDELWESDIAAYDSNHVCMSEFADLFSSGIVYQNMDMFCSHMTGA